MNISTGLALRTLQLNEHKHPSHHVTDSGVGCSGLAFTFGV